MRGHRVSGRWRGALLGALLWSGVGGAAWATTAPPLSLAQQARKADVIVRATLGAATTVSEGGVTYLVYPLTVSETVAGDPAGLPQHQGGPALFFLQGLADLPTLTQGQEVFALLYNRRLDSPLVGFNQGLYVIASGAVSGPSESGVPRDAAGATISDPAKLRDAIRAARETR